jgi:hypothetical protein
MRRIKAKLIVRSLRFTRKVLSKLRGQPFGREKAWAWYEPIGRGFGLMAGVAAGWLFPVVRGGFHVPYELIPAAIVSGNLLMLGLKTAQA